MKIALLSDIHANIYALKAVLDDLDKEHVEKILILGDYTGYYYWPGDVVDLLMKDTRCFGIAGNHEKILHQFLSDPASADKYRQKYGSGYDSCLKQLSDQNLNWLFSLPDEAVFDAGGLQFYLSHGALGSTEKYIYPDASIEELRANYSDKQFTVFGHTHYPFLHQNDGKFLINPGSVGQPRDLSGSASYVIIDINNLVIRFKRKCFNVEPVVLAAHKYDPALGYLREVMVR